MGIPAPQPGTQPLAGGGYASPLLLNTFPPAQAPRFAANGTATVSAEPAPYVVPLVTMARRPSRIAPPFPPLRPPGLARAAGAARARVRPPPPPPRAQVGISSSFASQGARPVSEAAAELTGTEELFYWSPVGVNGSRRYFADGGGVVRAFCAWPGFGFWLWPPMAVHTRYTPGKARRAKRAVQNARASRTT